MKTRTKQKSKQTEERFEKVVTGGEDLGLCILGLISVIIPLLSFLAYVSDFEALSMIGFVISIFIVIVWAAGLMMNLEERKVYWRKIK